MIFSCLIYSEFCQIQIFQYYIEFYKGFGFISQCELLSLSWKVTPLFVK